MDSADCDICAVGTRVSGEWNCFGPISWNMASFGKGNLIFPILNCCVLCDVYGTVIRASGVLFRTEFSVCRSLVWGKKCRYISWLWSGLKFISGVYIASHIVAH